MSNFTKNQRDEKQTEILFLVVMFSTEKSVVKKAFSIHYGNNHFRKQFSNSLQLAWRFCSFFFFFFFFFFVSLPFIGPPLGI